jgi:hypothetical protein
MSQSCWWSHTLAICECGGTWPHAVHTPTRVRGFYFERCCPVCNPPAPPALPRAA